ncbi:DUF1120 domain-containing protein [Erwinia piriflorinigrans]|uniref:Protein gltF n=1 Tax=Erwinia piriflorinigrans CFBP 5888 TaxID=1161919 RepID=V5ZAZ2_9GAMM|nr:DUF1120 domain-containing protein [Erwinia piriflorinigrans]CCG88533.1 Protein gltF [Erwinia piriflorinigrans CFBP 5888]
MKTVNSIIALALMAATSTMVQAESIDVKVIGTIAPVACTPTISGGGIIDYGNIPTNTLSATDYTLLAEKQLDFAITCEAPVKLALKATNGRPGTLAGVTESASGFGNAPLKGFFGSTGSVGVAGLGLSSEKKIGGYGLRIDAASSTADGKKVDTIQRISGGRWANTQLGSVMAISDRELTWAEVGTITPVSFTNMTGKLGVQAYINKTSELDLTQPIDLDGLSTLELVYL